MPQFPTRPARILTPKELLEKAAAAAKKAAPKPVKPRAPRVAKSRT